MEDDQNRDVIALTPADVQEVGVEAQFCHKILPGFSPLGTLRTECGCWGGAEQPHSFPPGGFPVYLQISSKCRWWLRFIRPGRGKETRTQRRMKLRCSIREPKVLFCINLSVLLTFYRNTFYRSDAFSGRQSSTTAEKSLKIQGTERAQSEKYLNPTMRKTFNKGKVKTQIIWIDKTV